MKTAEWREGLPTRPGLFLVYGIFSKASMGQPRLLLVKAIRGRNGILHLTATSMFLYASETVEAYHIPLELPPAPLLGRDT